MCAVHVVDEDISASEAAAPNGAFIRTLFISFFCPAEFFYFSYFPRGV